MNYLAGLIWRPLALLSPWQAPPPVPAEVVLWWGLLAVLIAALVALLIAGVAAWLSGSDDD